MSLHPALSRRRLPALLAATGLACATGALSTAPAHADGPARPDLAPTAATAAVASTSAAAVPAGLRRYQSRTSLLGTHTWYRQFRNGHVVVNGWYAVHSWNDGTTTTYDGRQKVARVAPTASTISPGYAARRVAQVHAPATSSSTSGNLMVLPGRAAGTSHLVWRVLTTSGHGVTASYVDAGSGQTLRTVQLAKRFDSSARSTARKAARVTGKGKVFDPNPVVALQNQGLRDRNDGAGAVPRAGYRIVDLPRLDTSHSLKGQWAKIVNRPRATSATDSYRYNRADDRFEQVSAYYAVDAAQAYLRSLRLWHVNADAQRLHTDAFGADNSYYNPAGDVIATGTGGVDDAEDPEVVWHEYGHAVQDDQVPDYGLTLGAQTIGEGFGDYLAVTMSQLNAPDTAKTPWGCVMDWDATSYTTTTPHCLRRTDTNASYTQRAYEPHADAPIWSGALWQMNLDLTPDVATQIIVEAQFNFTQKITLPQAARVTVQTAEALYPGDPAIADTTRQAFQAHDILP